MSGCGTSNGHMRKINEVPLRKEGRKKKPRNVSFTTPEAINTEIN